MKANTLEITNFKIVKDRLSVEYIYMYNHAKINFKYVKMLIVLTFKTFTFSLTFAFLEYI